MGNREIKFRGWDERAKLMHEDFRYIKSGDEGNDWIIFTSSRQTLQEKHHPFENPYFQEQFKIMQYTGLKDANGVEIYEGDVVEDHNGTGFVEYAEKHAAFRVNYANGQAKWFYDYNLRGERESIQVIGNIYQNPELLNG